MIIQDCLEVQAPVKVIQIAKRTAESISDEAKEMLASRDNAHLKYKRTRDIKDFRNLKT